MREERKWFFIKNTIYDLPLNPSVHTMESTENNAMSNEEVIEILQETIDEQIKWCYSVDPETNEWVAYDPDRAEIELTEILISCDEEDFPNSEIFEGVKNYILMFIDGLRQEIAYLDSLQGKAT